MSEPSIEIDGATATYILDMPAGYDENRAYPLVFAFHGAGVPASSFKNYFNITMHAGPDAIVIVPNCPDDADAWNEQRDLPYFDALLEKIESELCIDKSRVFAAGHSSGGFMTHTLGCRRGDVLRAIAPLSAGRPNGTCTGDVAVWISHGISDEPVPIATGRAARDFWAMRNMCDATMSTPVTPSPCVEYSGCAAGLPVRYCEYEGTHNLPSFAPGAVWDFFASF